MAMNLNKINSDYYSVQQDDSLLVKSFKFPKISWNGVSKEQVRVLQLILHSKICGILKLIQGIVWQKWLRITCALQDCFPKQLWKFAVSSGMSKVLMLEVFELSCQAHKSFLTQMATAVSSLPERGWCLQLVLSPKNIREKLRQVKDKPEFYSTERMTWI